jgi:outer membrane autotransporter protein
MKKLLIVSIIATIATSSANANDRAYVGLDLSSSHVKNKVSDGEGTTKISNNIAGFGLNAGYKINFNKGLFVAPEVFFDYLNNKSSPDDNSASYKIDSRYGAKLNLGYNFNEKFSVFANYGLANVRYKLSSSDLSENGSKIAAIYGLGFAYNINEQLTAKIGANRQKLATGFADNSGLEIKSAIETYSVGLAYNF